MSSEQRRALTFHRGQPHPHLSRGSCGFKAAGSDRGFARGCRDSGVFLASPTMTKLLALLRPKNPRENQRVFATQWDLGLPTSDIQGVLQTTFPYVKTAHDSAGYVRRVVQESSAHEVTMITTLDGPVRVAAQHCEDRQHYARRESEPPREGPEVVTHAREHGVSLIAGSPGQVGSAPSSPCGFQ